MTMRRRHFLQVSDLSAAEIAELFRVAAHLKRTRRGKLRPLAGKTLGLLFHKPSVRTRVSFEVGMAELGGRSLYIGPVELQHGQREAPRDVAQVLARYLDGIVARTFQHRDLEEMAAVSRIPIINGLSDFTHPCQALADLFTLQEKLGKLRGARLAFVGDGNNVCHALMQACALTGMHLAISTPAGYRPHQATLRAVQPIARRTGGSVRWIAQPAEAVRRAQAVYTDVWTSMGQEGEGRRRRIVFRRFQVNARLMRQASRGAFFLHCLPAHRGEEVTDDVLDSPRSIVYDQAENRLHVQKAILLRLLRP